MTRTRILLPLLLLAACSGTPTEGPDLYGAAVRPGDGLEYRAETRVLESFPVQIQTTVTITNTTAAPVTLTFPDGCIVLLRAYREGDTTGPAWDQATELGCTMALVDVPIDAGQSVSFEARTDARQILGDRLPDGRYQLRAFLRPNGRRIEIPAGTVELAVPRSGVD